MHVTYIPCKKKAELCAKMKELSEAPQGEAPSFLEATVYSQETSVIMLGEFDDCDTPEKKRKVNRINDWWQPWYYTHVEKALTHGGFDEYIPVRHYHHRCVSCMHRLSVICMSWLGLNRLSPILPSIQQLHPQHLLGAPRYDGRF